jgi:hypothetical protein
MLAASWHWLPNWTASTLFYCSKCSKDIPFQEIYWGSVSGAASVVVIAARLTVFFKISPQNRRVMDEHNGSSIIFIFLDLWLYVATTSQF